MPLTASDFVQPQGDLRPDQFPGVDDLTAQVGTWLTKAEALTVDIDDAQKAEAAQVDYVYYRAYHTMWLRLTTSPAEQDFDGDGSFRYTVTQISSLKDLADSYKADFDAALTSGAPTGGSPELRSVVVQTNPRWL